jgi:enediyne biosynthesis protein E4
MRRQHFTSLVAVLWLLCLYFMVRTPKIGLEEMHHLAKQFKFRPQKIHEGLDFSQSIHRVAPQLSALEGWISSLGSSVAIADLDGDGLPNDLCFVDPRTDLVTVTPLKATERYLPFSLNLAPLSYYPELMSPFGCLPGDMDEDGDMDLLVYFAGRPPVGFFQVEPLIFRPSEIISFEGLEGWIPTSGLFIDLNGDTHMDLVLGCYFQDGTGIYDPDFEGREEMPSNMGRAFNGGKNRFLVWKSDASMPFGVGFEEIDTGLPEPALKGWTVALAAADFNGDLRPEIYFANTFGQDRLLLNESSLDRVRFSLLEGTPGFTVPLSGILGQDTFKAGGVDIGDLNGDGLLDIFVSNVGDSKVAEGNQVFLNSGKAQFKAGIAPFNSRSRTLGLGVGGWGWGVKLADFNNDGALEVVQANGFLRGSNDRWVGLHELYWGNPALMRRSDVWPKMTREAELAGHQRNRFFVKGSQSRYEDLSGAVFSGNPENSRGVAVSDVDGDGDLDLVFANQWEAHSFYENLHSEKSSFLGLHILYPVPAVGVPRVMAAHPSPLSGRPALGAQVKIKTLGMPVQIYEVGGGNGHSGYSSPEIFLGIPVPGKKLSVEVRWRAGEELRSLKLDLSPGWHTIYLGPEKS